MAARRILLMLLSPWRPACARAGAAQTEPLPQPPPPPPEFIGDPDLEPQVTIIRRDEQVVEEVRIKGELRYVR
jgi:hypothetical protein